MKTSISFPVVNYKFSLFVLQLCLYFIGIGFSAGGGNFPTQQSNGFGVYKSLFIMLPVLWFGYLFLKKPKTALSKLGLVFKANSLIVFYFIIAAIILLFAVDAFYSLGRLFYTLMGFAGLIALLTQYFFFGYESKIIYLKKIINYFSFYILLFPLYVACTKGLENFRFKLEGLYLIHPNILAAFYAHVCLWHGISFLLYKKKSIANIIYSILFLLVEYLLFSRAVIGGLLICFSVLPFLVFFYSKNAKALILGLFILLSYMVLYVLVIIDIIQMTDLASLVTRNDSLASLVTLTNRTILWQELIGRLEGARIVTGYGYSVIDRNFGIDLGTGILYGAHNTYLSILLGSGIFALLAILFYLTGNVIKIIKQKNMIEPAVFYSLLCSYLLFLITGCSSEEIGVSFSVTFAYLVMMTTIVLRSNK